MIKRITQNNAHTLSVILMMLLFPLKSITLNLKGYYGVDLTTLLNILKIVLIVPLFIFSINSFREPKQNKKIHIIIIIILFFIIQVSQIIKFQFNNFKEGIFIFYISVTVSSIAYFIIGLNLPTMVQNYKKVLLLFMGGMSALTIAALDYNNFRLSVEKLFYREFYGNYLFWADSFSFVSIMIISTLKTKKWKILLIFVTFAGLYSLNSRSSLISYSVFFIFYTIIEFDKKYLMILAFLFISYLFADYVDLFGQSRMLSLKNALSSKSMLERNKMFLLGVDDIKNNPFWGEIGGQLNFSGTKKIGSYTHNIVSYYRQFGIISFLIIVFLAVKSIKDIERNNYVFYLMTYIFTQAIFFKSFTFTYIWIIIGYLSRVRPKTSMNNI